MTSTPAEVAALLGGAGGDVDDVVDLSFLRDFIHADKFKMDQVRLMCFFISNAFFRNPSCYFSLFLHASQRLIAYL